MDTDSVNNTGNDSSASSSTTTTAASPTAFAANSCIQYENVNGIFCNNWNEVNHFMFQIGNILIVVSLVALFMKPSLHWHLFERFFLSAGCFALTIWAWYVHCAPDIVCWNLLFGIMHLYYVLQLAFKLRPIRYFDPVLENIRQNLFPTAQLHAYDKLMGMASGMEHFAKGSSIMIHSRDCLRLVVSGKIQATAADDRVLYHAVSLQFADSPSRLSHAHSVIPIRVTMVAKSRMLVWDSQALHDIARDGELAPLLNAVLAADVAFKLRTFLDSTSKPTAAAPSL